MSILGDSSPGVSGNGLTGGRGAFGAIIKDAMGIKQKAKEYADSVPKTVWTGVGAWVVVAFAVCAYKYWTFEYRDMDLAYFAQAIWNTAHFRLFHFTLHPTLTLGDHAEWILLPIAAVYRLLPNPLTLLGLQALALGSGAIPLYFLAARKLPERWAVGTAIAYLFLAVPANAALFEFHALAFALPLLLWTALAYEKRDLRLFLILLAVSLAVREDVAVVGVGFAAVAALDRRGWRWILGPACLSLAFLAFDWLVIRHFALAGSYKFSVYYGWLTAATPLSFLRHLTSIPVIEFLLGMLMPFLALPIIRPKWLLVSLLPTLGIVLMSSGGGALAIEMHYAVLALPGFLLASLDGLSTLLGGKTRLFPWAPLRGQDATVLGIVLGIAVAAQAWSLGPIPGLAASLRPVDSGATAARALTSKIPPYASVAASESLLPALADRPVLYSLKYMTLGVTQYSVEPYAPEPLPEYLAMDSGDALLAAVQYPTLAWTQAQYPDMPVRLRKILVDGGYGLVWQSGHYYLWQKGAGVGSVAAAISGGIASSAPTPDGPAEIHGLRETADCGQDRLCLLLSVSLDQATAKDLAVTLSFKDKDGKTLGTETRLLGDLYLPAHEWQAGEIKGVKLDVPAKGIGAATEAWVQVFAPEGALVMGPLRSSQLLMLRPQTDGAEIPITK